MAEDQPGLARLLENGLQYEGYHVLAAKDGAEAIDVYERYRDEIDVIVTDLGLPKISGSEVIRKMKKQPRGKDYCHNRLLRARIKIGTLSRGGEGVHLQPYSFDEVLAKLRSLLDAPEAR